jgi:uncharacterized glyoxalase superfamily protein PhnB
MVISAGGAVMTESSPAKSSPITFIRTVPILRIFAVEKAKEFYCGFLGFTVDWEHTFEPNRPVYMQISRGGLRLHLSEHHGDGSPGIRIFVEMTGVDEFHREVTSKSYKYLRPGVQDEFYGARTMHVIDPFGNTHQFQRI